MTMLYYYQIPKHIIPQGFADTVHIQVQKQPFADNPQNRWLVLQVLWLKYRSAQKSCDPRSLACADHVSDTRNDFPRPMWGTPEVFYFTLLTHVTRKKTLIIIKKSHHHHNAATNPDPNHYIDVPVVMVWLTKLI